MKKKMQTILVLVFLSVGLLGITVPVQGETFYVRSLSAVLKPRPAPSGKALAQLKRGEKVRMLNKSGIWSKVAAGAGEGWLPSGQLSKTPVVGRVSVLAQKVRLSSKKNRRVRLRTFVAVVGVKGLVDRKNQQLSPYQTDYPALEGIEHRSVDEEDAVGFLKHVDQES